MNEELNKRLNQIEQMILKTKSEASDKGNTFIIIALWVLLIKSCE